MRRVPSSDTTAKCRLSGENAKALMRWFDNFQKETGLNFWFLECTDLSTWSLAECSSLPLLFSESPLAWMPFSSGKNAASSFSLSYTTRDPSIWAARNRFSDPGIQRISETGVALIIPWKLLSNQTIIEDILTLRSCSTVCIFGL